MPTTRFQKDMAMAGLFQSRQGAEAKKAVGPEVWKKFDAIYVVSYVGYRYRIKVLEKELARVGIEDYKILYDFDTPIKKLIRRCCSTSNFLRNNGPLSCLLGHYRAMKEALGLGCSNCLIIEDDVAFLKDVSKVYEIVDALPADYDMAMFSHVVPQKVTEEERRASMSPIFVNEHWREFRTLRDNGCYALSREAMKFITDKVDAALLGVGVLCANDVYADGMCSMKKLAAVPNVAVQNCYPLHNSGIQIYYGLLKKYDNIDIEDYSLAFRGTRVFVFTNVYRFSEDKEFERRVRNLEVSENDICVFMNKCLPLHHLCGLKALNHAKVVTLHREMMKDGKLGWFGYDEARAWRKAMLEGEEDIGENSIVTYKLSNGGVLLDDEGKEIADIEVDEGYPDNKMPTTGYYALKWAMSLNSVDVIPVNFYGKADNSTGKFSGHDWEYEDAYLATLDNRIFLEDEGRTNSGTPRPALTDRRERIETPVNGRLVSRGFVSMGGVRQRDDGDWW